MKELKNKLAVALALIFSISISYSQQTKKISSDKIHLGKTCVIVQHSVSDFDTWIIAYRKDGERRGKSGIHEKFLLRNTNDSNYITVVFELENVAKAKAFFSAPHSAKLMQAAGVISKPDLTYFKVSHSGIPMGKSFLLVQHTVEDYDYWKHEFDKHQNIRSKYKLSLTILGKDLGNALNVIAIFSSANTGNIKSFLEKSDLKEAMKNAGITSEPIQEIMVLHKI